MRRHGRIVEWHGERGFGFVRADGDDERAFAHVIDFTERGGMPGVGDHVSYDLAEDEPGRSRATNIRYAAPVAVRPDPGTGVARHGRHANGLALLLGLAVLGAGAVQYQRHSEVSGLADGPAAVAVAARPTPVPSSSLVAAAPGGHACTAPPGCAGDARCDGPPECTRNEPCRDPRERVRGCATAAVAGDGVRGDGRRAVRSPLP